MYIRIPKSDVEAFTQNVGWFKRIQPIEVNSPADTYILPEEVLDDSEIVKAVPHLTRDLTGEEITAVDIAGFTGKKPVKILKSSVSLKVAVAQL